MFQPPYPEEQIPEVVAGRMDRQLALFAGRQRFEFLITEAALRWRPGPSALLEAQLDRIASLSTLDSVSIGLIPLSVRAVTNTSHGFVLFEMAERDESDAMVLVETIHANLVVNDPESIALYQARWSLLKQMAVYGNEARAFIDAIASNLRKAATLIQGAVQGRHSGNAAHEGALHPRTVPARSGSVEVELASLHGLDEFLPFGHVEPEHRPIGVLGVAHRHDLHLAGLNARSAALAGAGEADRPVHRDSVHRISLSRSRRGISAPSLRKPSRGHLERNLERNRGRELPFSCAAGCSSPGGRRSCLSTC
jgi:hypothetical protein